MDTSTQYILMCEKASGIQECRGSDKWEDGDWFIITADVRAGRKPYVFSKHCEGCLWEVNNPEHTEPIWLPRQDQLQNVFGRMPEFILGTKCNCQEAWSQVSSLKHFMSKHWVYLRELSSMEQLWLAFLMREKYSKVWEGDDWKKI